VWRENFNQVQKRDNRRRNLSSLQLGNEALRQFRPVRQFLLRQFIPVSEVTDFPPDFRVHLFYLHALSLLS
jgi:hypothetical protein